MLGKQWLVEAPETTRAILSIVSIMAINGMWGSHDSPSLGQFFFLVHMQGCDWTTSYERSPHSL